MRSRVLGNTGLRVTELALGTWGLSGDGYGAITPEEQDAVLERSLALGIRLFDVADSYGKGSLLTRLGEHLERFRAGQATDTTPARVILRVGTDREAHPPRKRFDKEFLHMCVKQSLERAKLDKLDIVLLHNPSAACLQRGEATGALAELAGEGLLSAWGASCGNAAVAQAALEAGCGVIQVPYNVLYQDVWNAVSEDAGKKGVGVLFHSVLGYGSLSGFWSISRKFQYADHRQQRWSPEQLRERLRQASALRSAFGEEVTTMRGVAVRYALDHDRVSSVILGPRTPVQLDQLVREAGKKPPYLSTEQRSRLHNRLQDLGVRV